MPAGQSKDTVLTLRVQDAELKAIDAAASKANKSRTDFLRAMVFNTPTGEAAAQKPPTTDTWLYREAGGSVRIETSNPLPRVLWERLVKYVAMLEPEPISPDRVDTATE
jgi:hypothetical protein